jgi:serine/threonine protein kinase
MKACKGQKNVVELLEFEEYGSEMYFVMEFCPSTLLKSVLEENEVRVRICAHHSTCLIDVWRVCGPR